MRVRKHKDLFWLSYSDLMTSMFFIMLALFIVCCVKLRSVQDIDILTMQQKVVHLQSENEELKSKLNKYEISKEHYEALLQIQTMFSSLSNGSTLSYREKQRTFVVEALEGKEIFEPNKDVFKSEYLPIVDEVGKDLRDLLKSLDRKNENCSFQLVIEGTTANTYDKAINKDSNSSYRLSYMRALALYDRWRSIGIDLRRYNTEILICGSGMNGLNRDKDVEDNNKRVVIQIIPKFDKI